MNLVGGERLLHGFDNFASFHSPVLQQAVPNILSDLWFCPKLVLKNDIIPSILNALEGYAPNKRQKLIGFHTTKFGLFIKYALIKHEDSRRVHVPPTFLNVVNKAKTSVPGYFSLFTFVKSMSVGLSFSCWAEWASLVNPCIKFSSPRVCCNRLVPQ